MQPRQETRSGGDGCGVGIRGSTGSSHLPWILPAINGIEDAVDSWRIGGKRVVYSQSKGRQRTRRCVLKEGSNGDEKRRRKGSFFRCNRDGVVRRVGDIDVVVQPIDRNRARLTANFESISNAERDEPLKKNNVLERRRTVGVQDRRTIQQGIDCGSCRTWASEVVD